MIVYVITNLINSKKYVGQTIFDLKDRWTSHKSNARNGSTFYIHKALMKYGFENFEIKTLVEVGSKWEMDLYEKGMIKAWDLRNPEKGYNLTDGGEGIPGRKHSEETKLKMRLKRLGYVVSAESRARMSRSKMGISLGKGRKLSEEHCKNIGLAKRGKTTSLKGRKKSKEHIENMRRVNLGKKLSAETKAKISKSLMGHPPWNNKRKISEDEKKDKGIT